MAIFHKNHFRFVPPAPQLWGFWERNKVKQKSVHSSPYTGDFPPQYLSKNDRFQI